MSTLTADSVINGGSPQNAFRPTAAVRESTEPLISEKMKLFINCSTNGAAATFNLISFLNGNFHFLDTIQEKLEQASELFSKLATASQGFVNSTIAYEKKNLIACIGGALEIPIGLFISGFNSFLARGVSAGLNHFDSIISRIKRKTQDKNIEADEFGNEQYYDDFKKEGWITGVKTIFQHFPILFKELKEQTFERNGLFPRSFFLCSLFMILGPLISLTGLYKLGATVRHFFGGLAGVALATDMKTNTNIKQKTESPNTKPKGVSNYATSGVLWVLAAIPDVLKHFDFFSSRLNNGTELALLFDRLAGLFFIFGNQRRGEK